MFLHTDTPSAPWRLVAGDDKPSARLTVVEEICGALERALD